MTSSTLPLCFFSLTRQLHRVAAGLALAAPVVVLAQTGLAPAMPSADAAASASAPSPLTPGPARRPTPRVTSPSDASRSLDLNNPQPEGKVTPQLRIPLGKKGDTPLFQRRRPDTATAPDANSVNESAARCDALTDPQARAGCRAQRNGVLAK